MEVTTNAVPVPANSDVFSLDSDYCSSPSAGPLRYRRELRYSREQAALARSLYDCSVEPSPQQLQIKALEQARELMVSRASESERRLSQLRRELADEVGIEQDKREELLRRRWVEEQRMTALTSEIQAVTEQMVNLKALRPRSIRMEPPAKPQPGRATRMSANLDLFLQKSPTKRPLQSHTSRAHSITSLPPTGRVRSSASVTFRSRPPKFHSRSRSLVEEKEIGKLRHIDVGTSRANVLVPPGPSSSTSEKASEAEPPNIPAVDEFVNSFSSRVVSPVRVRKDRPVSIKQLKASSTPRRPRLSTNMESAKAKSIKAEYGRVTILSSATPQTLSITPVAVPDVGLPSYAISLLDGFSSTSEPLLQLRQPETAFLTFRQPVPLAPLMEQSSISTSPSQTSLPSPAVSPTLTAFTPPSIPPSDAGKGLKKQRSIFSLRLPKRRPSVPHFSYSVSHVTLPPASATTTAFSESSADLPSQPRERLVGLPSTRLYDLSQVGPAPDDLPRIPMKRAPQTTPQPPATPRRKVLAPFSALKNRLALVGRR